MSDLQHLFLTRSHFHRCRARAGAAAPNSAIHPTAARVARLPAADRHVWPRLLFAPHKPVHWLDCVARCNYIVAIQQCSA
jgi:hypothetical protein